MSYRMSSHSRGTAEKTVTRMAMARAHWLSRQSQPHQGLWTRASSSARAVGSPMAAVAACSAS